VEEACSTCVALCKFDDKIANDFLRLCYACDNFSITTNLSDFASLKTNEEMSQLLQYLTTLSTPDVLDITMLMLAVPKTTQSVILESLDTLSLKVHKQWLAILKTLPPPDCSM
jgi:hypothetical protein